MKGYVCILWGLSLAVLGEGSWFNTRHLRHKSVCPKNGSKDPILLPHKNCSQFYVCINGKATVMNCRDGRHFDKRSGQCEHALKARCKKDSRNDDLINYAVIGMRSRIKEAPFMVLALLPASAIKGDNFTRSSAMKRLHHRWIKRYVPSLDKSTEQPRHSVEKPHHSADDRQHSTEHRHHSTEKRYNSAEQRLHSTKQRHHSTEDRSKIKCPPYKYVRYKHFACLWGKKVCPRGTNFNSATSRCERRKDGQVPYHWAEQQHRVKGNKLRDKTQSSSDRVVHTKDRPILKCPLYMKGKKLRNVYDCKTYYYCDGGIQKLFNCPSNLFFDPNKHRCNRNGKWFC